MNEEYPIDSEALVQLNVLGGPEFVRQMIELFLADTPKRIQALRSGQAADDLVVISDSAHTLKSSARTLGANDLHALSAHVESVTRQGKPENLGYLLDELERACQAACVQLEMQRENYPE